MHCVCVSLRILPACSIRFACLFVPVCWRKLAGIRAIAKAVQGVTRKSDNWRLQVDNRSWGVLGPRRQQIWFRSWIQVATQRGFRRSIVEERSSRFSAKQIGESGTRLSPTCVVYSKGRVLYDRYAQKSKVEWRTVQNSRRWKIQRWECAGAQAASEIACFMHALQ